MPPPKLHNGVYVDEWNLMEKVTLACSVSMCGEDKWVRISELMKKKLTRWYTPDDWYTPATCAVQWELLVDELYDRKDKSVLPLTQVHDKLRTVVKRTLPPKESRTSAVVELEDKIKNVRNGKVDKETRKKYYREAKQLARRMRKAYDDKVESLAKRKILKYEYETFGEPIIPLNFYQTYVDERDNNYRDVDHQQDELRLRIIDDHSSNRPILSIKKEEYDSSNDNNDEIIARVPADKDDTKINDKRLAEEIIDEFNDRRVFNVVDQPSSSILDDDVKKETEEDSLDNLVVEKPSSSEAGELYNKYVEYEVDANETLETTATADDSNNNNNTLDDSDRDHQLELIELARRAAIDIDIDNDDDDNRTNLDTNVENVPIEQTCSDNNNQLEKEDSRLSEVALLSSSSSDNEHPGGEEEFADVLQSETTLNDRVESMIIIDDTSIAEEYVSVYSEGSVVEVTLDYMSKYSDESNVDVKEESEIIDDASPIFVTEHLSDDNKISVVESEINRQSSDLITSNIDESKDNESKDRSVDDVDKADWVDLKSTENTEENLNNNNNNNSSTKDNLISEQPSDDDISAVDVEIAAKTHVDDNDEPLETVASVEDVVLPDPHDLDIVRDEDSLVVKENVAIDDDTEDVNDIVNINDDKVDITYKNSEKSSVDRLEDTANDTITDYVKNASPVFENIAKNQALEDSAENITSPLLEDVKDTSSVLEDNNTIPALDTDKDAILVSSVDTKDTLLGDTEDAIPLLEDTKDTIQTIEDTDENTSAVLTDSDTTTLTNNDNDDRGRNDLPRKDLSTLDAIVDNAVEQIVVKTETDPDGILSDRNQCSTLDEESKQTDDENISKSVAVKKRKRIRTVSRYKCNTRKTTFAHSEDDGSANTVPLDSNIKVELVEENLPDEKRQPIAEIREADDLLLTTNDRKRGQIDDIDAPPFKIIRLKSEQQPTTPQEDNNTVYNSENRVKIKPGKFRRSVAPVFKETDLTDQPELLKDRKMIALTYVALQDCKYADTFRTRLTDDLVPFYSKLIYSPINLIVMKRKIENGLMNSMVECQKDVLLMLSNAKMYNLPHTQVYRMTSETQTVVLGQIKIAIETTGRGILYQQVGAPNTRRSLGIVGTSEKQRHISCRRSETLNTSDQNRQWLTVLRRQFVYDKRRYRTTISKRFVYYGLNGKISFSYRRPLTGQKYPTIGGRKKGRIIKPSSKAYNRSAKCRTRTK